MKKASIIGLGDILKGDLGVGCYIIEALEQERLGDLIHLAYLALLLYSARIRSENP